MANKKTFAIALNVNKQHNNIRGYFIFRVLINCTDYIDI